MARSFTIWQRPFHNASSGCIRRHVLLDTTKTQAHVCAFDRGIKVNLTPPPYRVTSRSHRLVPILMSAKGIRLRNRWPCFGELSRRHLTRTILYLIHSVVVRQLVSRRKNAEGGGLV